MSDPEPLVEWDPLVEWEPDRAGELAVLWSAAMPNDPIGVDDVEAVCFGHGLTSPDDVLQVVDAATIATASGSGAVTVTVTGVGEHRSAHLQLLVVHPGRRSRGIGRVLVAAAEQWVRDRGIDELTVGGAAPFYLFTGIDSRWTPAICLFESLGYERSGAELDLSCATRGSAARRAGTGADAVVVESVDDDERAAALMAMVERDWPLWSAEFRRAAEAGTVSIARDGEGGAVLGAAAHSVSRFGVVGPVRGRAGRSRPWHWFGADGGGARRPVRRRAAHGRDRLDLDGAVLREGVRRDDRSDVAAHAAHAARGVSRVRAAP